LNSVEFTLTSDQSKVKSCAADTLAVLRQRFKVFRTNVPLKRGIHEDIRLVCPELSSTDIAEALTAHTLSEDYLRACRLGAQRWSLLGNRYGHVRFNEALSAAYRLKHGAWPKSNDVRRTVRRLIAAKQKGRPGSQPGRP
jgi:sRNA-binding protein